MNVFGNWQNTEPISRRQFARAAAAHEDKMPEDDHKCVEDCPDCKGSGFQPESVVECLRCDGHGKLYLHVWHRVPGEAADGTKFCKCIHCPATKEV